MMKYLEKFGYSPEEETIASNVQSIIKNLEHGKSEKNLKECFALMDLTTLHPQDTPSGVREFVRKVNKLQVEYPSYPLPASICVFPNFIPVVVGERSCTSLHATSTAGSFPDSQSFPEVKELECRMAVRGGADEIDIVLALNAFLDGDFARAESEIRTMRAAIDEEGEKVGRKVVLKVILETGILTTPENIAEASLLAMECGADFIKTSTGKVEVNATPTAAYIMCECIRKYFEKTGRKVGFKAAGGISTAEEALCYYFIVSNVLGKDWLCPQYFRLGVSRLGNSLMSAIEQKTVKYF